MRIKVPQLVWQSVKSSHCQFKILFTALHIVYYKPSVLNIQMMECQPQYYILDHSQGRKIKVQPYRHGARLLQLFPTMDMCTVSMLWIRQDSCRFIPLWHWCILRKLVKIEHLKNNSGIHNVLLKTL